MDILALLECLQPCLSATTLRQLSLIAVALLTMTGRVTMTGIALEWRWRQLPHHSALLRYPAPVGTALLALLLPASL